MTFDQESQNNIRQIKNGEKKLKRKPGMVGLEVEQFGARTGGTPRMHGDNPTGLPMTVPSAVENRASIFHLHYDGSGPIEFSTQASQFEAELYATIKSIVGDDWWYWTNEFKRGSEWKGCGSHTHFSVLGDISLGTQFANQQVGNASQWAILNNNLVELGPLFAPFWSFGVKYRSSALNHWAVPTNMRLSPDAIISLFQNGSYSNANGGHILVGHNYTYPSFNRHAQKQQITIENRLCENHPYWTLPAIQLLGSVNSACFKRDNSMKLTKTCHDQLNRWWGYFESYPSYKALSLIRGIEFLPGRGMPYLCGGPNKSGNGKDIAGSDRVFPDGLNLFRMLCRRFMKSKMESPINYGKVMRMYYDMIDLSKVPANLIWDVNELYRRLYEDTDKIGYQNAYLYVGSAGVMNPDIEGRFRAVDVTIF